MVFDTRDTGKLDGFYPDMIMSGNNPVFGYVDLSAANDLQMRRWNYNNGTPTDTPLIRGLGFDQMAMAVDGNGYFSHLSIHNFSGGNLAYIFDTYASDYADNNGAAAPYWFGYTGNNYGEANNDALVMDSLNYAPGSKIGRYINPKLIARGNTATNGTHAKMFMSFYDSWADQIVFRSFQVGRAVDNQVAALNNSQRTNYAENPGNSGDTTRKIVVAAGNGANQYYDLGMTSDNRAIVVYYDKLNSVLKMKYSSTVLNASNPSAAITWVDSAITFPTYVGEYVRIFIHTDNSIHIAAQDSLEGDLVYMKVDTYNSTAVNTFLVEAYKNVGSWADIKVNNAGVPYIAYYNKSDAGSKDTIKLAWLKNATVSAGVDSNGVTGAWEAVTVPANDSPQGDRKEFQRVNLGFNSANNPVVGYLANDIEWSQYLPELND
jgi:large repetitive protein